MLKIRRSWDRLIFNMGMPILVRRHLYIETAPWCTVMNLIQLLVSIPHSEHQVYFVQFHPIYYTRISTDNCQHNSLEIKLWKWCLMNPMKWQMKQFYDISITHEIKWVFNDETMACVAMLLYLELNLVSLTALYHRCLLVVPIVQFILGRSYF